MKVFTKVFSPVVIGVAIITITSGYIIHTSVKKVSPGNQNVAINTSPPIDNKMIQSSALDSQISFADFQADTTAFSSFIQSVNVQNFSRAEGFGISGLKAYLNLLISEGQDSVYVYFGDKNHTNSIIANRKFSAIFWKKPGSPALVAAPQTGGSGSTPYDTGSLWP